LLKVRFLKKILKKKVSTKLKKKKLLNKFLDKKLSALKKKKLLNKFLDKKLSALKKIKLLNKFLKNRKIFILRKKRLLLKVKFLNKKLLSKVLKKKFLLNKFLKKKKVSIKRRRLLLKKFLNKKVSIKRRRLLLKKFLNKKVPFSFLYDVYSPKKAFFLRKFYSYFLKYNKRTFCNRIIKKNTLRSISSLSTLKRKIIKLKKKVIASRIKNYQNKHITNKDIFPNTITKKQSVNKYFFLNNKKKAELLRIKSSATVNNYNKKNKFKFDLIINKNQIHHQKKQIFSLNYYNNPNRYYKSNKLKKRFHKKKK